MSSGPLVAALLDRYAGRDVKVDLHVPSFIVPSGRGIIYDHVTSPGFVTAGIWLLQGLCVFCLFREPVRIHANEDDIEDYEKSVGLSPSEDSMDSRVKASLQSAGVAFSFGSDDESDPLIAKAAGESEEPSLWNWVVSEVKTVKKLVFGNMALPVTFLVFGFIELADEVLISSCSMVGRRYFGWHASTAGFMIASLGALVLPAHFVVEKTAHYFEDRTIIKVSIFA